MDKFACVMCGEAFTKDEMDFLGRCIPCFHKYMTMPEDDRPKLSKPFVPIYHGGR
jgi:DNA-directed RNA polymerase subunit RPC12/RpoP